MRTLTQAEANEIVAAFCGLSNDPGRCQRCGWRLATERGEGCTPGLCLFVDKIEKPYSESWYPNFCTDHNASAMTRERIRTEFGNWILASNGPLRTTFELVSCPAFGCANCATAELAVATMACRIALGEEVEIYE